MKWFLEKKDFLLNFKETRNTFSNQDTIPMEESTTNALLNPDWHIAVTQYIIPTVVAVFAALFQIIAAFRTKLGKKTNEEAVAKAGAPSSSKSDELITELQTQYSRQRRSQKIMLFLTLLIMAGVLYLFLNTKDKGAVIASVISQFEEANYELQTDLEDVKKVNKLMGIVDLQSLYQDEKTFTIQFDKSCASEYVCMVNESQVLKEIDDYLNQTSRAQNMVPVLFLTGFATQDADVVYNSRVSMRRATIAYQKLAEKYIIGGINIAELSGLADERGNATSVTVSIAWNDKIGSNISASPDSTTMDEELIENPPDQQLVQQVIQTDSSQSESPVDLQDSVSESEQPTSSPPPDHSSESTNSTIKIETIYTTDQISFESGMEDIHKNSFRLGQRVYVRFKVHNVQRYQRLWLVWKKANGEEIRDPKQIKVESSSNRIHDYKTAFPAKGLYRVEVSDLNGKLLASTEFTIQ